MKQENEKEILYRGNYLQLVKKQNWEWVERVNCSGVVMMLGMTAERKVILVEQYRVSLGKNVIEFPAGLVGDQDKAENLETAARREFLEETGYTAERWTLLMDGPPSAGMSSETVSIFLAEALKKVGAGGGDESEKITVHEVELSQVEEWLWTRRREGTAVDPKVYSGLYFLLAAKEPAPA
ncbi:MAG TPA: hypothetical protein DF383_03090 [Deltaproteobacteria bacterium]|nr:hypothetical protein [Deltaproteobacteria bacterium]